LIAGEVALSVVLLVLGGLLLRSFLELGRVETGFDTERLIVLDVRLPESAYPDDERASAFYRSALENLAAIPGVLGSAAVSRLPLTGENEVNPVSPEGTTKPMLEQPIANVRYVSPDYFRVLGIPLRQGRSFRDDRAGPPALILSQGLARQLWPERAAVGLRARTGDEESPLLDVVGVVGDVRAIGLEAEPSFMAYVPFWQDAPSEMSLIVRTALPPKVVAGSARAAIGRVDPDVPVARMRTMEEVVSSSVEARRFQVELVAAFAAAALLLASLGIFGVVSYSVTQRRGEIGVRMALGATARHVRLSVLRQGMRPVAAGLGIGLGASVLLGRLVGSLLFGVGATDPVTLAGVPLVLLLVASAACLLPAIRASRLDPLPALRAE
ncbi:MAG: ABC transporter permease, partial [Gemmatimonadetes bacterium]|nr:ABC transporter permease [Gemmatimonadota bacterium]